MPTRSFKPFTPSRENPSSLDARTIGREDLIDKVVNRLARAATTKDRTHTLLIGPRGAGKTHIVEVALHRLSQRSESKDLLVVRLPEDLVGVTSYQDLLVDVAAIADNDRLTDAVALRTNNDPHGLEDLLADVASERTIVLAVENLTRLFDALDVEGQRSLRAWVETSRRVVLLATAPLLMTGVSDRDAPWFGSFAPDYLEDLSVDEGQRLLIELHHDDPELAEYLATETAHRRLTAIAHLAGGSPRLWIIAAMCVTIESLDELVPAVEDLLERLVPYYQERLWELSPLEQKLVRAIAEDGRISVRELAERTGEAERSVGTTLRRLEDARWVRGVKRPDKDQRMTFYELREPLVRHHLDYRNTDRQTLQFIVEVLKAWFDPPERLRSLGSPGLGPSAVEHIAASLAGAHLRSGHGYASGNVDKLRATARLWASGEDGNIGSEDAGHRLLSIIETSQGDALVQDREIDDALASAVREANGSDRALFGLIHACWSGVQQPAEALRKLAEIDIATASPQLRFVIRNEIAYFTGRSGDPHTALDLCAKLIPDQTKHLGPHHPDTLLTRAFCAYFTGMTGDHHTAVDLCAKLIPDQIEHLGPLDNDTLSTRAFAAYFTGMTGDHRTAFDLCTKLINDAFGSSHLPRAMVAVWLRTVREAAGSDPSILEYLAPELRLLGEAGIRRDICSVQST